MQNLFYENKFDLHENEPVSGTHLHMNGFTRRLVLTPRWLLNQNRPLSLLKFNLDSLCFVPPRLGAKLRILMYRKWPIYQWLSLYWCYWMFRKKSFHSLCNQEIVDLEPVTGADVELVKGLVQEHKQLTGSTVAERLLEDWDSSVNMFVKVQLDKGQFVVIYAI